MELTNEDEGAILVPKPSKMLRTSTSREIVDYVRAQIFAGEMRAGERINQDGLAEEFGVSRLPVREALITLESEGFVRSELHRGAYVIPITRADIEDHYEVYGYIQGIAAGRAAKIVSAHDLELLDEVNSKLASATDPQDLRDLDWQFHSIINRIGGSNGQLRILRQLGRALPQSLYAVPPAASELAAVEHSNIIAALRKGAQKEAAAAVTAHTAREGAYLVQLLDDSGVLESDHPLEVAVDQ